LEGALAPDPSLSGSGKAQPLREIPGLRKKEKTWKDEVKDRIRHRRRQRAEDAGLPLFDNDEPAAGATEPPPSAVSLPLTRGLENEMPESPEPRARLGSPLAPPAAAEPLDLPLRTPEPAALRRGLSHPGEMDLGRVSMGEETDLEPSGSHEPQPEWSREEPAFAPEVRPVERPALLRERVQAAAVDLGLLVGLWALVVYFASRAAHVPILGLRPAWPSLLTYLAFLGVIYGGYFGGTTGQTLGKIWVGLRVVDVAGRPTGYLKAFFRTALGAVGVLLAGLGLLPMLFDPARRALHDRILHTRVIKG
jgi:uncharacterized RDD family membrane protein YckC